MMERIEPDMKRHCYYNDKGYGPAICYDYAYNGFCKRYQKALREETVTDTVDDVGRFNGQVHRFPVRCDECQREVLI